MLFVNLSAFGDHSWRSVFACNFAFAYTCLQGRLLKTVYASTFQQSSIESSIAGEKCTQCLESDLGLNTGFPALNSDCCILFAPNPHDFSLLHSTYLYKRMYLYCEFLNSTVLGTRKCSFSLLGVYEPNLS